MSEYDYTNVPIVARHDHDTSKLNFYAMIHGVEVLIASQKAGHFVGRIEANKAASEQEAAAAQPAQ